MQIIGRDKDGSLIGVQRGLFRTTVYRGRESSLSGLGGLDDLGKIDWNVIFQGINSNPLVQGIGARIAGQGQPVVPINPYQPVQAQGPGFFGSINPMYMLIAAGLGAVLLLKR